METPELSDIEKKIKKEEEQDIIDLGETLKRKIAENGGQFSETIPILPDGKLEIMDKDNNLKSLFAHRGRDNPEDLYRLAFKVQQKAPELVFTFARASEGQSISYTVQSPPKQTV
ncbi:MAG: hypothetical protein ACD_50C00083G0020 [uncultured bacterium]|nr:MAG: hypothetical protein ACD_50C00083G0020 [uncultured bacterium]OGH13212.1 MAG: hypothetical protein A2687_00745 [Candidatus Levybacteria bacterium RIFCSPHIGHO2_01_FULL_38_26]